MSDLNDPKAHATVDARPAAGTPPKPSSALTVHSARIVSPISYLTQDGVARAIPKGPCLIEKMPGLAAEIIWGAKGQNSTALAMNDVKSAEDRGQLVLLD